ncbi:hypothetical protein EBU24_05850 [bacterium]|nr:hypothetical protein [bacterium]
MFVTTTQVKTITGKVVNASLVERAQYAIEAYVGKFEADVEDTKDLEILKRATAYQAAYMLNNEDIVFEQMAVSTTMQNDASTTFKAGDKVSPFIAPMAVMMCDKLSFMRARSIYTGKMSQTTASSDWRTI